MRNIQNKNTDVIEEIYTELYKTKWTLDRNNIERFNELNKRIYAKSIPSHLIQQSQTSIFLPSYKSYCLMVILYSLIKQPTDYRILRTYLEDNQDISFSDILNKFDIHSDIKNPFYSMNSFERSINNLIKKNPSLGGIPVSGFTIDDLEKVVAFLKEINCMCQYSDSDIRIGQYFQRKFRETRYKILSLDKNYSPFPNQNNDEHYSLRNSFIELFLQDNHYYEKNGKDRFRFFCDDHSIKKRFEDLTTESIGDITREAERIVEEFINDCFPDSHSELQGNYDFSHFRKYLLRNFNPNIIDRIVGNPDFETHLYFKYLILNNMTKFLHLNKNNEN